MSNNMKFRWLIMFLILLIVGWEIYQSTRPSTGLTCVSNCEYFEEMKEALNE